MKTRELIKREIAAVLMAAVADEATQDDLEKLNQILSDQPDMVDFVVDLMSQEAWLSWYTARSRNGEIRTDLLENIAQVVESSSEKSFGCNAGRARDGEFAATLSELSRSELRIGQPWYLKLVGGSSRFAGGLAAVLLIAIGALIGSSFAKWHGIDGVDSDNFGRAENLSMTPDSYVARYVHGTACLWNQKINAALTTDDALRTGESLSLLEGLAELKLDWNGGSAALRIEGPAGLVLTAERGASLSHGRFTADIEASDGQFSLNTPNGLIEVTGTGSLGVAISGGNVELHVFKGTAAFVGPWTRGITALEPVEVNAGDAIRIAFDIEGRVRIDKDTASVSSFASKVSMGSDHLAVSPAYVQEVISAGPLAYWRFEDSNPKTVANEMGDNYHAMLTGEGERVRQGGNTSLELGAGLSDQALQSYVFCDEPLEADFSEGYTLETWVKPSHYHWGSLVGFLGDPEQPGWRVPHGLLLEIGGPRSSDSEIEHPGRVRYLHRNPPGGDFKSGTSCFSEDVYELRKWQHIAAVKSNTQLCLYINGSIVAQVDDATTLSPGLKVIIGQLDREQFYRKFIGQIDEFAIYARPLSEEEVVRHHKLVRPSWQTPAPVRKLDATTPADADEATDSI
jgi:hypothetical protein